MSAIDNIKIRQTWIEEETEPVFVNKVVVSIDHAALRSCSFSA